MSISLNLDSPNKNELAQLLHSIADMIKASANQTVSITGTITFEKCKD